MTYIRKFQPIVIVLIHSVFVCASFRFMLVLNHVTPMSFYCIRTHFNYKLSNSSMFLPSLSFQHRRLFQAKLSFIPTWFLALSQNDPTAPLPSCRLILPFHAAYFGLPSKPWLPKISTATAMALYSAVRMPRLLIHSSPV